MIRLYRDFMEVVLMGLIYMRDSIGDNTGAALNHTYQRYRGQGVGNTTPELTAVIRSAYDRNQCELTWTEIINEIAAQIHQRMGLQLKPGTGDKDLIDTIVRTIQLPHCRSMLSGEALNNLRRALLLPDELAGLNERLKAEELSCCGCGKRLATREMVTIVNDGGDRNNRAVSLLCAGCYLPEYIACANGKHTIAAPGNLHKNLRMEQAKPCAACEAERVEKEREAEAERNGTVAAPPDNIGLPDDVHVIGAPRHDPIYVGMDAPAPNRLREAAEQLRNRVQPPGTYAQWAQNVLGNPPQVNNIADIAVGQGVDTTAGTANEFYGILDNGIAGYAGIPRDNDPIIRVNEDDDDFVDDDLDNDGYDDEEDN